MAEEVLRENGGGDVDNKRKREEEARVEAKESNFFLPEGFPLLFSLHTVSCQYITDEEVRGKYS